MKKITLHGGNPLYGEISVGGSKNAALPIIFACILTKGVSCIRNLPDIGDVRVALEILRSFGAEISFNNGITNIDTNKLSYSLPDKFLVSQIRASTYLIGSCLARFGRCHIQTFGGCNFAQRPIDMHIDACLALGAELFGNEIVAKKLCGGEINFEKKSVGATVNAILLASVAEGETLIRGIAREPHIDALIDFLISCGAHINRNGDDLYISGAELHGGQITIIGDMIEAGTYLVAGLITGGEVSVVNCPVHNMQAIFQGLEDLGSEISIKGSIVSARIVGMGNPVNIVALPYPGFPTDLQPIFAPLMAAFSGGKITDTVWQTRFGYLKALSEFGVDYLIKGNSAEIRPSSIKNSIAVCPDLRGGMACLLTALRATGKSEILSAEIILRGYENLEEKLCALGTDVFIENL